MNELIASERTPELWCSFWVAGHWFGVPAQFVREVHTPVSITRIPGAPRSVLGYVNLRGQLVLVLSARALFLQTSHREDEEMHLVVFNAAAGESFAIQTGSVGEIVSIRRDQVDLPSSHMDDATTSEKVGERVACMVGHAKLDRALLTMIDPRRLLAVAFEGLHSS
jgi:purine-binding chemotaxis protein CheW